MSAAQRSFQAAGL